MVPWNLALPGGGASSTLRRASVAGLLAVLSSCGGEAPPPRPNVVIWMVDGLRADHVGCYGHGRPTSPNLDRLAADGVLFEEFHVHATRTGASVASLLGGVHPPRRDERTEDEVPDGMTLLSEWFARHGYDTLGVTQNDATAAEHGFAAGYDRYHHLFGVGAFGKRLNDGPPRSSDLVEEARFLLEDRRARGEGNAPFFLFLESSDPRVALAAVSTGSDDAVRADERYDEAIAFDDAQLGRFLSTLEEQGLTGETLVVVVSDHGHEPLERAGPESSRRSLHREATHVPLVLRWPGVADGGRRLEGLLGGIDLAPTVVDLAGLPPLPDPDGRSFAAAVRGELELEALRGGEPARVFVHGCVPGDERMAVRTADHFLALEDPDRAGDGGAPVALYDLTEDPGETRDVSFARPDLVRELTAAAARWDRRRMRRTAAWREVTETRLDPALREVLDEAGYLE